MPSFTRGHQTEHEHQSIITSYCEDTHSGNQWVYIIPVGRFYQGQVPSMSRSPGSRGHVANEAYPRSPTLCYFAFRNIVIFYKIPEDAMLWKYFLYNWPFQADSPPPPQRTSNVEL